MKEKISRQSDIRRAHYLLLVLLVFQSVALSGFCEAAEFYEKVIIDKGQLHIITKDHKKKIQPIRTYKLKDEAMVQVDVEKPDISKDRTTVGWLVDYPNCCTSYPIPLELILYKDGKILQVFTGTNLPIWKWQFVNNGTQVSFEQETVHGGSGVHYELRETDTGNLIDSYDGEPEPDAPKWVRDLK